MNHTAVTDPAVTDPDRRPVFQTIAIVASCLGLFIACGIGPSSPPHPPPPPITVSLSASTLDFPNTAVGGRSASQLLTITNADASPLSFSVVVDARSRTQIFVESNTCRMSLQPDQSCTIGVVYKPSVSGHFAGLLYLYSPGRSIIRVPIAGTAVAAAAAP